MLESLFKKSEQKTVLAIDFGSEAVKSLLFKRESGRILILAYSVKSFENFGIFDASGLEHGNTKKIISDSVEEIKKQSKEKISGVYLRLPSDILKGEVSTEFYERKDAKKRITEKEGGDIFGKIFEQVKKNISKDLAAETGIMPQDFRFVTLKIFETKIDGYETEKIYGFAGKTIECGVLATFLPEYYFRMIVKIFKDLKLDILNISHTSELLTKSLHYFGKSGIFLDVGGDATQIISVKNGKIEAIGVLNEGGRIISRLIAQVLNIPEKEARILKERYSKGELSEDSRARMKEIVSLAIQNWFYDLKIKVSGFKALLPSEIFIFGGGSQLIGIRDILEEGEWATDALPDLEKIFRSRSWLISDPKAKIISPKEFKNIINVPQELNNPQFTTVFLQTI